MIIAQVKQLLDSGKSLKVHRGRLTHSPSFCVRLEDHNTCQFPLHLHIGEHSSDQVKASECNPNI